MRLRCWRAQFGYSVALGAFLGGALVAESGASKTIEPIIEPIRDVFAAVFFVSVGMLIDPVLVAQHWGAVLVLTVVVVVGKVVGITLGNFLAGNGVRTSVQAGMSMAQIGEFSFIIAGVGLSLGAVRSFIYPVAVAVSALTTLITPFLIRASGPVASFVDRRLPHPVQTFAALYGTWVDDLGATPGHASAWARVRRLAGLLVIDIGAIAAIVIGASVEMASMVALGGELFSLNERVLRGLLVAAAVAVAAPFLLGAVRLARALGTVLAAEALPISGTDLDLAATPRRALLVTLQLTILLVAGIPLVAITQPFLSSAPALLLIGLLALVVPFWRSATNLHGHVRAGAQVLLEALARQSHAAANHAVPLPAAVPVDEEVKRLVPGMGEAITLRLDADAPGVGKTLKQLDLRGLTGASVIAIERGPNQVIHPSADEALRVGDCLVLAGTDDAIAAARGLLSLPAPAVIEESTSTTAA